MLHSREPLKGHKAKKLGTRRQKKLAGAGVQQRRDVEERERERWLNRLIEAIIIAKLPLALRTSRQDDQPRAMRRCAKGRRGRTIREHVRLIEKFQDWHCDKTGTKWPTHLRAILDYIEARAGSRTR